MIAALALRVWLRGFGRLPLRLLYALADAAGTAAWCASPRLRDVTLDHMRHALGGEGGDAADEDGTGRATSVAESYAPPPVFLTYRAVPVAVPAETVSENTTDQAPVPSLIAADEMTGAVASAASSISVLAAEAAMLLSEASFTAPASK